MLHFPDSVWTWYKNLFTVWVWVPNSKVSLAYKNSAECLPGIIGSCRFGMLRDDLISTKSRHEHAKKITDIAGIRDECPSLVCEYVSGVHLVRH